MTARILICRANPLSPDPRVEKEARTLAEAGYDVLALGWDRAVNLPAREHVNDYSIQRLQIPSRNAHGLGNFPYLLRWQWSLWRWLIKNQAEFDVIHACDFDTVLPALWCQRFHGKLVVYDIFDFYTDMLRATPEELKKMIRWVDFHAIRLADATIIADEARKEQIAGSHPNRLTVIYNCLDDQYPNLDTKTNQKSSGNHLHLVYFGNLQVERGLLVLLDVMRHHPEWSLDLGGFGPDEALIRQAAKFPGVTWHGLLPYKRVLELSADADLLFATYDPSIPNHRYSSPNKLFEAMMLGKPIIVAQNTNMDRVVLDWDCGQVLPYGDGEALEAALIRYKFDPDLRYRQGQNARKAFEQLYNWGNMQQRLLALYAELLQPVL